MQICLAIDPGTSPPAPWPSRSLRFDGPACRQVEKVAHFLFLLGFLVNALKLISFYEKSYAELNEQGIATTRDMAWPVRDAPFLQAWCAAL